MKPIINIMAVRLLAVEAGFAGDNTNLAWRSAAVIETGLALTKEDIISIKLGMAARTANYNPDTTSLECRP